MGLSVVVLRPEFVYGPGDLHLLPMFRRIGSGLFPMFGDGNSRVHPTYIGDLVQVIGHAVTRLDVTGAYLVCGAEWMPWRRFVTLCAEVMGRPVLMPRVPAPAGYSIALMCELAARTLGKKPVLTRGQVTFLTSSRAFCTQKARQSFGYIPTPIRDGLQATIGWYRSKGLLTIPGETGPSSDGQSREARS